MTDPTRNISTSPAGVRRTAIDYLILAAVAGFVVLLLAGGPSAWSLLPACPLREATGWYCAGCGGTRAVYHLLRGDIVTAFGLNPLFVVSLPLLGGALVWRSLRSGQGRRAWNPWWIAAIALLVLGTFSVLRNLQSSPFGWMAP